MSPLPSFKLHQLPASLRLVISLTLLVLGIGYLIAVGNLYLTYNLTDGEPGLAVSDLRRAFYGRRDNTKLASKIDGGSMAQFLPRKGDKEKILSWIQDGAERAGYDKTVRPILAVNCLRCHNPEGLQRFVPLTTYEEVMTVTQIDRGEPVQLWARVSHTHIQSIGLILFVLGGVFVFTSIKESAKAIIVCVPFATLLADFGMRFLARYWPSSVYLMLVSGATLALSFLVLIVVPLYEMWLKKPEA